MELIKRAFEFEKRNMSNMSTSDRVFASREAKSLVLTINKIYKKTKDPSLMDIMKRITKKKHEIDRRLKGLLMM